MKLGALIVLGTALLVASMDAVVFAQPVCTPEAICPGGGPCVIGGVVEVEDGCVLDFGDADLTIANSGQLRILELPERDDDRNQTRRDVVLRLGSFTVERGGVVDGQGDRGADLVIQASRDIVVEGEIGGEGRIVVSGVVWAGSIFLDAGGSVVLDGVVKADNVSPESRGGVISVTAGEHILTGRRSIVSVRGGNQDFGGDIAFAAVGSIDTGNDLDASGGDGGLIGLSAGDGVVVRKRLFVSGGIGDGGEIEIVAGGGVTLSGPIQNQGGDEFDGGIVLIAALEGQVSILDSINANGGPPDGTGGSIEIIAGSPRDPDQTMGGSIVVQHPGEIRAEGAGPESDGGEICLEADDDIIISGEISGSGGDAADTIDIVAGGNVVIEREIEARGTAAGGSSGGTITIEAGTVSSGDVLIDARVTVRGNVCDATGSCGSAGDIAVFGCDITITEQGELDASSPGVDGFGGTADIVARRTLTVNGPIDATASGGVGTISIAHAFDLPPIVNAAILPPADVTACDSCEGFCAGFCIEPCDCGNEKLDTFEECDGGGCGPGTVCAPPGSAQACTCISTCGDGKLDEGEECEPTLPPGVTCEEMGFPGGGEVVCDECTLDSGMCDPGTCGDGVIAKIELCEPDDLNGTTCESLGFVGGNLGCAADCMAYDTSSCARGSCGDGFRCFHPDCGTGPGGGAEECDDGPENSDDAPCLSDCSSAICGDGVLCTDGACDSGPGGGPEECDEGSENAIGAPCRDDCGLAVCGDGIVCSDSECTSGPGGGPEECDEESVCCGACGLQTCQDGGPCVQIDGCCRPDKDCDDSNACTSDQCFPSGCFHFSTVVCSAISQCHEVGACDRSTGVCSNPVKADGTPCDDGDLCTLDDRCVLGECVGDAVVCSPLDGCHEAGTCDSATGECTNPPKPDGTGCDDGDACTRTDTCQAGVCEGSDEVVCTALDSCHEVGTCDSATGECTNPPKPDGTGCDDGNACTRLDECEAGACVGSDEVSCEEAGACFESACDPASGECVVTNFPDGTSCDDGDLCTKTDRCEAGNCMGFDAVTCTALDQCHEVGDCDPSTGECTNPVKADGVECDDGNACTQVDACEAGACVGTDEVVCPAAAVCHASSCDESTGECVTSMLPDDTPCDEGDPCSGTGVCQAGSCVGLTPKVCTPIDQCHEAGDCDPSTGECTNPLKSDGAECDDDDACTRVDACESGVCVGGDAVVCADPGPCLEASCDPATGDCVDSNAPDQTPCDDGSLCTPTDLCLGGACVGLAPVICTTALDQCHDVGVCEPTTGECTNPSKPDGTECDDGDACTQTDQCLQGVCVGSSPVTCTDPGPCAEAACDPATGVCSDSPVSDGTPCDDGNLCTTTDSCLVGVCVGAAPVVCPEPEPCHEAGVCDPATGVCSSAESAPGTSCDDGDPCTSADGCQAGVCTGTVIGLDGFSCTVAGLTAPGLCEEPLPKNLAKLIPKKVSQAQKAVIKARQLVDKGAKPKKIDKQLKKMQKALAVIEKKVSKAERSKNARKQIAPSCAAALRALTGESRSALLALGS